MGMRKDGFEGAATLNVYRLLLAERKKPSMFIWNQSAAISFEFNNLLLGKKQYVLTQGILNKWIKYQVKAQRCNLKICSLVHKD